MRGLAEPGPFKGILRQALRRGASYPAARANALAQAMPHAPPGLFTKPNNGLAMEYCKALYENAYPITPLTLARSAEYKSASVIRDSVRGGGVYDIPPKALAILQEAAANGHTADPEAFGPLVTYLLLRGLSANTPDMDEGLYNRFRAFAGKHDTLHGLLSAVKTKAYTYTRLQRAAMHMVLGITGSDFAAYEKAGGPPYIRVLGFNKKSAGLLGELTNRATLPVIVNPAKARASLTGIGLKMFEKEAEAAGIYALACASGRAVNEYAAPVIVYG
jgi:predicted nucleotidyltransferase